MWVCNSRGYIWDVLVCVNVLVCGCVLVEVMY